LTLNRVYRHGVKSYEIVRKLLGYLYNGRPLSIVDLTYGVGRFYRLSRTMIGRIIAVDIRKHEWEVEPTVFYQMDCRVFVNKVLLGVIDVGEVDVVVVDPPWSAEKRGVKLREAGISDRPYHIHHINSKSIVYAAMKLSGVLGKPLLYRYKEPLACKHSILAVAEVKMIRNRGWVYYGVCEEV
jgi:predicted RNA methylase